MTTPLVHFKALGAAPQAPPNDRDKYLVWLTPSDWDDYGYKTSFTATLHHAAKQEWITLGPVKILARSYEDSRRTSLELPDEWFTELPMDEFCSLGQASTFYANLFKHTLGGLEHIARAVLDGLSDICRPWATVPEWLTTEASGGLNNSLLRHPDAQLARELAPEILRGVLPEKWTRHQIRVSELPLEFPVGPAGATISFDGQLSIPGRIAVIVGKNGAGKTTLLSSLARVLSNPNGEPSTNVPEFSRVIHVSFNPYDSSSLSESRRGAHGSLRVVGVKPGQSDWLARARSEAGDYQQPPSHAHWIEHLGRLFPTPGDLLDVLPEFAGSASDHLTDLKHTPDWLEFASDAFEHGGLTESLTRGEPPTGLSAGQRVLVALYAGLFANLDYQSLVLIDEPENHLHPSLISRFVRQLQKLLHARHSFAVIATHSPIVVQETPSRFVHVASRSNSGTELSRPVFQTFGRPIDEIDDVLFETDFRNSNWKAVLRELAQSGRSVGDIEHLLGGDGERAALPSLASAYFDLWRSRKSSDQGDT